MGPQDVRGDLANAQSSLSANALDGVRQGIH